MRNSQITVSIQALQHNLQKVRDLCPHSKIVAMVKANAYGHGLLPVAKALSHADMLGVALVEEAAVLRAAHIKNAIVVLEGAFSREELLDAIHLKLDLVVHHEQQVALLENTSTSEPLNIWLKINTGMNRLGFNPEHVISIYDRLSNIPYIKSIKLLTHFASADDKTSSQTEEQIAIFQNICKQLPDFELSMANSAAILNWPQTQVDWVRPGIMLYGCSPCANQSADALGLLPAMTVSAPVMAVHRVRQGDKVGYGGTWQASKETTIAVIAIGYGDGYPRHAQEGTPVLLGSTTGKLVGRVSMDMITVDFGDYPVEVGAICTLWGKGLPIEEVAEYCNTIPYTLVCQLTSRLKRVLED